MAIYISYFLFEILGVGPLGVDIQHAQDLNLFLGLKQGDAQAWDEYMTKHGHVLTAWLYMRLRSWQDAEDVHMETLEVVLGFGQPAEEWKASRGYSLKNWLWRLAWQRAIKLLRKKGGVARLSIGGSVQAHGDRDIRDSDRLRSGKPGVPDKEKLRLVMRHLEEHEQELFRLRYDDLLTNEQIAEATGVKPVTVRSALTRLREKIRRLLAET